MLTEFKKLNGISVIKLVTDHLLIYVKLVSQKTHPFKNYY